MTQKTKGGIYSRALQKQYERTPDNGKTSNLRTKYNPALFQPNLSKNEPTIQTGAHFDLVVAALLVGSVRRP